MATPECKKAFEQSQRYHPRGLSSCLPPEFLKDRPFEKKSSRRLSDPFPSKLQEMLYENLPAPPRVDNKEFIPHMMALKRIQDEFREYLSVKADEIGTALESDDKRKLFVPILIRVPSFEEKKRKIFQEIYQVSLLYNTWKMKIVETMKTISSKTLKEECCRFENEINKALEVIDRSLDALDGCYDIIRLKEQNEKFCEKLSTLDQTINELKKDIELEEVIDFEESVFRVFPSICARFCNILGLELDSLQDLEELDEKLQSYYSAEEWILMNIENSFRYLEDENKFELSTEALQNLGFAKHAANILVDAIPPRQRGHLTTIDWVTIYIKNQFKYHMFLAHESPNRFPFKKESTKKWFTLTNDETAEATSECNITNVSLINLEERKDKSFTVQNQDSFPNSLEDEEHLVLFHGTDHLSAKDILFDGIDVKQGRGKCDFSHLKGFYLTKSLEDAIDWSYGRPKSKPAVLVYRVEKRWLRNRHFLDLCGDSAIEEWKDIVRYNITGAKDKKRRKELDKYDFIEGPISTVPRPVSSRAHTLRHPSPQSGSYQICLNSENFAQEFNQTIHSIMFFDKKLRL